MNAETAIATIQTITLMLPEWERNLTDYVLKAPGFKEVPGSLKHHHSYAGGLAVHTAEVLHLCLDMSPVRKDININVLLVSAVWHDFHKIQEYAATPTTPENPIGFIKTPYAHTIGHIAGTYHEFRVIAETFTIDDEFVAAVSHCLLSHHGRLEWGSPVVPQTNEARILHAADNLSASLR